MAILKAETCSYC